MQARLDLIINRLCENTNSTGAELSWHTQNLLKQSSDAAVLVHVEHVTQLERCRPGKKRKPVQVCLSVD